ncbi:hypothetical protein Fcan01_12084 [Folsomia candida]|uniref:Uncharacterized protein n=1 Tax=Folsomia candida TaxID=158441 RepID=A0A226E4C7_FOLCA|nr:hypothetical protein Fcan01_12084 [Folsomia candida]
MDKIAKNSKVLPKELSEEILTLSIYGANSLALSHREISNKRRQAIRPSLGSQYSGICNYTSDASSFLFGENVTEKLKSVKSMSTILKPNQFRAHIPQIRGNLNWRGRPYQNRGAVRGRPFTHRQFQNRPQFQHRLTNQSHNFQQNQ